MHEGNAAEADPNRLVSTREALVKLLLPHIQFPQCNEPHFRLMPRTAVVVRDWRAGDPDTREGGRQENMSVSDAATVDIDVVNSNPALDAAAIISILRTAIERMLRDRSIPDHDVVTFRGEPGRKTPHIRPYMEHPDHTWVRTVMECMEQASGMPAIIKAGKGTADEGAVSDAMHIPIVILPPICEDEHKVGERVRLSSIERNAEVLSRLALVDHPLTYVDYTR